MEPRANADDNELVQRLRHLVAEADQLKREVERAADEFVERRKLGIDRRHNSRTDRRRR